MAWFRMEHNSFGSRSEKQEATQLKLEGEKILEVTEKSLLEALQSDVEATLQVLRAEGDKVNEVAEHPDCDR